MAAFVAALLVQATDKTAWLAAKLGTRFESPGSTIVAIAIALIVVNALAAFGAVLIAPMLTPNAKALLLAFALVSAGASSLFALKPPKVSDARAGAFIASLAGALALGLGDRAQFITFALAARTPLPALAAIGATLGRAGRHRAGGAGGRAGAGGDTFHADPPDGRGPAAAGGGCLGARRAQADLAGTDQRIDHRHRILHGCGAGPIFRMIRWEADSPIQA